MASLEKMVVGLYERGFLGYAEKEEDFITLKSGRRSPHYANFRGVMSLDKTHPMSPKEQIQLRNLLVDECATAVDKFPYDFEHLGPIPQAVTQLGGAVALRAGVSSVNVRVPEQEKGYGKHKPVEGDYQPGDIVLGFDDVITTWQAKSEFLVPIHASDLVVTDFLVVLDREEGGRQNAEAEGYKIASVIGMTAVNEILHDNGTISNEQYSFAVDYLGQYGDMAA